MKMIRIVILFFLTYSIILMNVNEGLAQIIKAKQDKVTRTINLKKKSDSEKNEEKEPEPEEFKIDTVIVVDEERKGPANITFSLADEIESEYDFSGENILDIYNMVFRDKNISSGYYYFLPSSYNLSWSESSGLYDFNANYGAADEGGIGKTTVTAILKPDFNRNEKKLAKFLLNQNILGKPEEEFGVVDLVAMPLAKTPEVEFTNLGQFDVGENDISIRAPSDLSEPIFVSFSTSRIDDLMGMFFNNIGLFGDIIIYPDGDDMPNSIRIPFNLKIDDPKTFGRFELDRSNWRNGWKNKTDYPLKLSNFHLLKKESEGSVKVYTWEMGDVEVPENAKVNFDASLVPKWIDSHQDVEKIWMEYTVLSCNSCNTRVKEKIIKGTSGSRIQNIEFTILTPMDYSGAELMKIKIRSYQADPNGNSKKNLPTVTLTDDGQVVSGGQLYVSEGNEPEFEYFIQIYLEDGTKFESNRWEKSNDLEVVIGKKQIEELIGDF